MKAGRKIIKAVMDRNTPQLSIDVGVQSDRIQKTASTSEITSILKYNIERFENKIKEKILGVFREKTATLTAIMCGAQPSKF